MSTINLEKKGATVSMTKSPRITATTSWINNKDYDIAAEVIYTDGHVETVVTYGTEDGGVAKLATVDGAVRHLGDVGATGSGRPFETIEINLAGRDNVRAVVIWGYSARRNGAGSFKEYEVALSVDNGTGEVVQMLPEHMSDHRNVYTLVLGVIHNTPQGVTIEKLEQYSGGGERRPVASLSGDSINVRMDVGQTNITK